jgi:hypothetical protein
MTTAHALCNMLGFNVSASSYVAFAFNDSSNSSSSNDNAALSIHNKSIGLSALQCFSAQTPFFGFCVSSSAAAATSGNPVCAKHRRDLVLFCEAAIKGVESSGGIATTATSTTATENDGDGVMFRLVPQRGNLLEARPRTQSALTALESNSALLINNATHWSSVCSTAAASTGSFLSVCSGLGFWGEKHAVSVASATSTNVGTGPVLLSNFSCTAANNAVSASSNSLGDFLAGCAFGFSASGSAAAANTSSSSSTTCSLHQSDVLLFCDAGSDSVSNFIDSLGVFVGVGAAVVVLTALLIALLVLCCAAGDGEKADSEADAAKINSAIVVGDDDDAAADEEMTSARPAPPARDAEFERQQQQKAREALELYEQQELEERRRRQQRERQERERGGAATAGIKSPPPPILSPEASFAGRLAQQTDPEEGYHAPRAWRSHALYQQQQQEQPPQHYDTAYGHRAFDSDEHYYPTAAPPPMQQQRFYAPSSVAPRQNLYADPLPAAGEQQGMIRVSARDARGGFTSSSAGSPPQQQQQQRRTGAGVIFSPN